MVTTFSQALHKMHSGNGTTSKRTLNKYIESVTTLLLNRNKVTGPVSGAMEELTNLRPFVWFCQFSGFIPFRMEIDPETKKFQRFSFSFRHPLTWWFAFLKILTWLSLCYVIVSWAREMSRAKQLSLEHICSMSLGIFHLLAMITVQFTLLHCSSLAKAIASIKKADESYECNLLHEDTVIRRTSIGFLLALCWVL